jgi:hypothetical protein
MMIPNKFNGYSRDGVRLYNDPATLTAIATASTGAGTVAGLAAPIAAAEVAAPALASTLPGILPEATKILPETLGGAQGIMQGAEPAVETTAGLTSANVSGAAAPAPAAAPATPMPAAGTQPGPLPNVTTTPNPTYANPAYEASAKAAASPANYVPTVGGPASEGILGGVDSLSSGFDKAMQYAQKNPLQVASGLYGAQKMGIFGNDNAGGPPKDNYKSKFDSSKFNPSTPFNQYAAAPNFHSKTYAEGGNVGAVEAMSNMNAVGNNSMYPMANIPRLDYANPMQQRPISQNMMTMGGDVPTDPYTGEQKFSRGGTAEEQISEYRRQLAKQEADRKAQGEALMEHAGAKVKGPGIFDYTLEQRTGRPDETAMSMFKGAAERAGIKIAQMPKANVPKDFTYAAANGGIMHGLGGYSDGGRLLKGPGDGVSDSIPAVIGSKQPARLADGEFVVPARIVSELGNGSTEAGARQLYAMMERIQKGRRKSVGKGKVAVDSKSKKHLPA